MSTQATRIHIAMRLARGRGGARALLTCSSSFALAARCRLRVRKNVAFAALHGRKSELAEVAGDGRS